jgi:hypothetical protein
VSQQSFQATLSRMVLDPDFRDLLRTKGIAAGANDLTEVERKRLATILDDKGLDATRKLHKSFRLTKLYSALPLTRRLVRPTRLAELISSFWQANPPVSHYFIDEAIAFCDFLQDRIQSGLRVKYLAEIVRYERANLSLRRPQNANARESVNVEFGYDPIVLFGKLANGTRPRAVPERKCSIVGSVNEKGEVEWQLSE